MSELPLRDAVRQHVEQRRLDDDQFAALQRLATPAPPTTSIPPPPPASHSTQWPPEPARPSRRWWLAIAAAVLLIGFGSAWWVRSSIPISQRIAAEVARNHQKLKPLEVQAPTLDGVRPFFAQLDFALVDSPRWQPAGWALAGARHCSVQGLPAAQLRLTHPEREGVRSVYMAPYDAGTFGAMPDVDRGEAPLVAHSLGFTVHIWVERGVLIAETGPPPPSSEQPNADR